MMPQEWYNCYKKTVILKGLFCTQMLLLCYCYNFCNDLEFSAFYFTKTYWDLGAVSNLAKIISNENKNYYKIYLRFSNDVVEGKTGLASQRSGIGIGSFTNSAYGFVCVTYKIRAPSHVTMMGLATYVLLVWKDCRLGSKDSHLSLVASQSWKHWSTQILWVLFFHLWSFAIWLACLTEMGWGLKQNNKLKVH